VTKGKNYLLGIDLGGTNIKIGIVNKKGVCVAKKSIPFGGDKTPSQTITRIVDAVMELIAEKQLSRKLFIGCGIGTPSPIDAKRTKVVNAVNLPGWVNVPIKSDLEKKLGMPVVLENDANVAAYGEKWVGVGKKFHSLVLYTLGTGIGGGIVIDDKLWIGAFGGGAEIGHMIIDINGNVCGCGNKGCIEAEASATAVVREFKKEIASGGNSSLSGKECITAKDICDAAKRGDVVAKRVVSRIAVYLATSIVSIVHIIEPEIVVLSGGLAEAGDILLGPVQQEAKKRIFTPARAKCKIVKGKLGKDAGVIGAAGWALYLLTKNFTE